MHLRVEMIELVARVEAQAASGRAPASACRWRSIRRGCTAFDADGARVEQSAVDASTARGSEAIEP